MKKYFIFILFLFFCFKVNSESIEILNNVPGEGIKIINHSKIIVHYIGRLEDGS